MSVDVTIETLGCCAAHNHQFTSNYTPALREAGFPAWKMLDRMNCHVVDEFVQRVIAELQSSPDRYEPLIRGGGEWGTMSTLLGSLRRLGADLHMHRHGLVRCT